MDLRTVTPGKFDQITLSSMYANRTRSHLLRRRISFVFFARFQSTNSERTISDVSTARSMGVPDRSAISTMLLSTTPPVAQISRERVLATRSQMNGIHSQREGLIDSTIGAGFS